MSEAQPKVYLLDIEGTVAPLSLTAAVLFPYARTHLEDFLWQSVAEAQQMAGSPDAEQVPGEGTIWRDLMMLGLENRAEQDPDAPRIWPDMPPGAEASGGRHCVSMSPSCAIPRVVAYVHWLMDRDRKSTALKSLQGKIWKAGFESGELKGVLFDDVPDAFKRWSRNARVAIYSSGSVEAQKLLFRHSSRGDLTSWISAYFDTRTGPKKEESSYAAIAAEMQVAPGELVFFSDSVPELDAARNAGCRTRLVMRPGNAPIEEEHGHAVTESLLGV